MSYDISMDIIKGNTSYFPKYSISEGGVLFIDNKIPPKFKAFELASNLFDSDKINKEKANSYLGTLYMTLNNYRKIYYAEFEKGDNINNYREDLKTHTKLEGAIVALEILKYAQNEIQASVLKAKKRAKFKMLKEFYKNNKRNKIQKRSFQKTGVEGSKIVTIPVLDSFDKFLEQIKINIPKSKWDSIEVKKVSLDINKYTIESEASTDTTMMTFNMTDFSSNSAFSKANIAKNGFTLANEKYSQNLASLFNDLDSSQFQDSFVVVQAKILININGVDKVVKKEYQFINYLDTEEELIIDPKYGKLKISVIDASTNQPVIDTKITILPIDINSFTNEMGIASFSKLPPNNYSIKVEKDGYSKNNSSSILLEEGKELKLSVTIVKNEDKGEITTITHNNVMYKTVTSPYTDSVWLDRNLGATKVCQSFNDIQCYGDYYQWGRNPDGHEKQNSDETDILATSILGTNDKFITEIDWIGDFDKNKEKRMENWGKIDGSSVCPIGFRVPFPDELKAETIGIQNRHDAFNNFLKLPSAGYRHNTKSSDIAYIALVGKSGAIYTLDYSGIFLGFDENHTYMATQSFGVGNSIRCIQEKITEFNFLPVTSPHTGRVWMDRNLGATRVCEKYNDISCYGDYYQWGREKDGHEKPTSSISGIQAISVTGLDSKFIADYNYDYNHDWAKTIDDDGSLRMNNWGTIDRSSICPIEYRIPTIDELKAETIDKGISNNIEMFNSFLKLPSAGERSLAHSANGEIIITLSDRGTKGHIWSNSGFGYSSNAKTIRYYSTSANWSTKTRMTGIPVRCIKD